MWSLSIMACAKDTSQANQTYVGHDLCWSWLILGMPWQPFFVVILIGFYASSTCCAEHGRPCNKNSKSYLEVIRKSRKSLTWMLDGTAPCTCSCRIFHGHQKLRRQTIVLADLSRGKSLFSTCASSSTWRKEGTVAIPVKFWRLYSKTRTLPFGRAGAVMLSKLFTPTMPINMSFSWMPQLHGWLSAESLFCQAQPDKASCHEFLHSCHELHCSGSNSCKNAMRSSPACRSASYTWRWKIRGQLRRPFGLRKMMYVFDESSGNERSSSWMFFVELFFCKITSRSHQT